MEHVDDPIIELEGFLDKQGARGPGKKKYKRRYFKLQPKGELHYYAGPKDVSKKKGSLGYIDLNRVTAIEQVSDDRIDKRVSARKSTILDGMHFDVVTPERTYCLVASTQKDLIRWVGALSEVVDHRAKLLADAKINLEELSHDSSSSVAQTSPRTEPDSAAVEVKSLPGLEEPKQVEDTPSEPSDVLAKEVQTEETKDSTPPPVQQSRAERPSPGGERVPVSKFRYDDVKSFLRELSGRALEVETPSLELQKALHQFQEMQIVHTREKEDAASMRKQQEALAKLQQLTKREQALLEQLESGVSTLHRESEKHTKATKEEHDLVTRLKGMTQALEEESSAYQELTAKLGLLEKQKGALSLLEHHDRNIRELQRELEELPKKADELERSIQCLELEITTIGSESLSYRAQQDHLPADAEDIDRREEALKKRLDELTDELRAHEREKLELEGRSQELVPRRKAIEKQQGTIDMFNKILDSPTWDEMLSAFSLVANLEQQANSLMEELGDSAEESSVAAVDVDKKERLHKKAEAFKAKLQTDKDTLAQLEGSLDGDRARNEAALAKTKEDMSTVQQELSALQQERGDLRKKETFLSTKLKDLEVEVVEKGEKLKRAREDHVTTASAITSKQQALVQEQATYRSEKDRSSSVSSQLSSLRALKAESESKLAAKHGSAQEEFRKLQALRKRRSSLSGSLGDLIEAQNAARAERRKLLLERVQILQDLLSECKRLRNIETAVVASDSSEPSDREASSDDATSLASAEEVRQLEQELVQVKAQVAQQIEEATRYKTRLNQLHVELDEARETNRRDSEVIMELTGKLEQFQEKLRNSSVGQLEVDLSTKEQELAAVTELYRNLEMETSLYDNARTIDKERIRQQHEEIKAKDQTIQQLQEQLHKAREGGAQTSSAAELHRELARLRAANHAHQAQNAQLEMEIRRLQTQSTTEQVMKDKAIAHLNQQLESMRADYQSLRHQALTKGGVDEATTRELDLIAWIKEKYFYALAVGVKLELMQRGTPVNLDVADLYQEAQYTVDVKVWQDWVYQKIMEAKPSEHARPESGARAGRGRGRVSSYSGNRPSSPFPSNW